MESKLGLNNDVTISLFKNFLWDLILIKGYNEAINFAIEIIEKLSKKIGLLAYTTLQFNKDFMYYLFLSFRRESALDYYIRKVLFRM